MRPFEDNATQSEFVAEFQRHVIPLYLELEKGEDRASWVFTTFAVSIHSQWLLMTAGHNLSDAAGYLEKGWKVRNSVLLDSFGIGARFREPVPFDFKNSSTGPLCKRYLEFDYGFLWVSENCRRLLEANNVMALDETAWDLEPTDVDGYKLLGFPSQLARIAGDMANIGAAFVPVERLEARPQGFGETNAPTFWGRVLLSGPLSDIGGMSGGPLFALKAEGGRVRYWLHAVQSGWLESAGTIRAPLTRPALLFLKEFMEGQHQDLLDEAVAPFSEDGPA